MQQYSCMKEVYYKYFEENILESLVEAEKERKKLVEKVIFNSFLYLLGGLACVAIFVFKYNSFNQLIFPIILFLMYFCFLKCITGVIINSREFQNKLQEELFPLFFKPIANFTHWPKNYNTQAIQDSGLFRKFNTQNDSSCIFGYYKKNGISISQTELSISEIKKIFKGTIIQIELEKPIDNHIILISKNERIHNKFKRFIPNVEELNTYFYTFAQKDNTEPVNKEFWQSLKLIGQLYNAKSLLVSCQKNNIIICLRQKYPSRFGSLFKSLTTPENFDSLIDRFICIYKLVDMLKKY